MELTEEQEQILFVQWMRRQHPNDRVFAIPNGGARHPAVAAKLKAGGVVRGVPDLFIPSMWLFLEMKRASGGSVSSFQKDWIQYLSGCGYRAEVAHGFEEAKKIVENYKKTCTKNKN